MCVCGGGTHCFSDGGGVGVGGHNCFWTDPVGVGVSVKFLVQRKTSCPLCNLNTLWTRRRVTYQNDNSTFLTFGVISLCYV